ncbi:hypothetical protein BBD46_19360 [Natrialba sp. SSL1]|nr:hypothetical protein BBD46_19360 [Natrialba sp. SSL1]
MEGVGSVLTERTCKFNTIRIFRLRNCVSETVFRIGGNTDPDFSFRVSSEVVTHQTVWYIRFFFGDDVVGKSL